MTTSDLIQLRLLNQRLAGKRHTKPADVVANLCAVQAQDYLGSLWAVALRMREATESTVEGALADRSIIRTWPMRGTLHFVPAADARWMLELLARRVVAKHAKRQEREHGITERVVEKGREVLTRALEGGRQLTRNAAYTTFEEAGIAAAGQRGLHILGRLAHEGHICFGPREGKQQTFVLLDEWVPNSRTLTHSEALEELARRYFTGHGPATLQDFVWWSGLTVTEAQQGLEAAKGKLVEEVVEGRSYWRGRSTPSTTETAASPTVLLLPVYDEYTVAYRDRSAALDPAHAKAAGNGIFSPVIALNGEIVGTWNRRLAKDSVVISPTLFKSLKRTEREVLEEAGEWYGQFLGLKAVVK